MFEIAFKNRLLDYLASSKLLCKCQYGYVTNSNTQAAAADVIATIQSGLDNNKITAAVFIDLSKALDTVDHDILLNKCDRLGIRGTPLQWLRSYLSNREQYVATAAMSSDCARIVCGVPQLSVLGPLLFFYL